MAVTAYQVATSSGTIYTPTSYQVEVTIQNLGPNPIYLQWGGGDATAAGGFELAPGAAFSRSGVDEITAICGTLQTTPNDTRVSVETVKATGRG